MSDAHEQIRNLLGRYCELIDGGDWDGLEALFADAVLADDQGAEVARGREAVQRFYQGTRRYDGVPRTRHLTTNTIIDVDEAGGTAGARSGFVVFQATDGLPLQPIVAGRYLDEFGRNGEGRWYFTRRAFTVDLVGDLSQHLDFEL